MSITTNYKNSAGTDLGSLFKLGNSGLTTGYKNSAGTDLGGLFASGNSGLTTGYKNSAGSDLGSLFALKSSSSTSFTITGATQSTPIIYGAYSICLFLGNGSIIPLTAGSSTQIGYLVVGGGGCALAGGGPTGGPGGGVNYCPLSLSSRYLSPSATYSIAVGAGLAATGATTVGAAGTSSISGTNVSISALGGTQSGPAVTTTLLQGGSYTGSAGGAGGAGTNAGNGGNGLNLSTIFSDINMSGYVAGGGGGSANTAGFSAGNGGLGGGSGGASRQPPPAASTGGAGVVTFGTGKSFGTNGGAGTAVVSNSDGGVAGANTGGGAGGHLGTFGTSTSGSGVVLIYWRT